jgi:hypothetical protein
MTESELAAIVDRLVLPALRRSIKED